MQDSGIESEGSPGEALWESLRAWYDEPLGQEFLHAERAALEQLLPSIFGFHMVQIGCPANLDLTYSARTLRRHVFDLRQMPRGSEGGIAAPEFLPVSTECLDIALLHHTLEFSSEPHAILREMARVLRPDGHLLICGFNPLSLWGLRKVLGPTSRAPWNGQFLSARRLGDWLGLLGFEVSSVRHYEYLPPVAANGLRRRLAFLDTLGGRRWEPLGAGYLLLSKKCVSALTPIRSRWRRRNPLAAGGVVETAPRNAAFGANTRVKDEH